MTLGFADQSSSIALFGPSPCVYRVAKNVETGEDYIPGFVVSRGINVSAEPPMYELERIDGGAPLTAAMKAFASLWWGDMKPDLILSSEAYMKRMVSCIDPKSRVPAMYGCNFGFRLNGAIWSFNDAVDCEGGWVFMLNTKHPSVPRLNGCYKAEQH